jgi:hypothetical protein
MNEPPSPSVNPVPALPWEMQEGESAQAFEAFAIYRDMRADRSLSRVGQKLGKSGGLIERWSSENSWQERVLAYDQYLDRREREEREKAHLVAIADYRDRQRKLSASATEAAILLLQKANARMRDLGESEEIPIASLPAFVRGAVAAAQVASSAEAEALGIDDLLRELDEPEVVSKSAS